MKKGDRTRLRLLEVASLCIAERGLDHLTVRSFAVAAEVSPGVITRYFPRTELILPAVIQYIFAEIRNAVHPADPSVTGEERILHIVSENFRYFALEKNHHNLCLVHSYLYVGTNREIGEIHRSVIAGATERLEHHVRVMGEQHGLSLSDDRVSYFARSTMQQLEGGLIHCSFLSKRKERGEFAQRYLQDQRRRIREFLLS